jgi:hypothetical protein
MGATSLLAVNGDVLSCLCHQQPPQIPPSFPIRSTLPSITHAGLWVVIRTKYFEVSSTTELTSMSSILAPEARPQAPVPDSTPLTLSSTQEGPHVLQEVAESPSKPRSVCNVFLPPHCRRSDHKDFPHMAGLEILRLPLLVGGPLWDSRSAWLLGVSS